jgi:hypothetical protein
MRKYFLLFTVVFFAYSCSKEENDLKHSGEFIFNGETHKMRGSQSTLECGNGNTHYQVFMHPMPSENTDVSSFTIFGMPQGNSGTTPIELGLFPCTNKVYFQLSRNVNGSSLFYKGEGIIEKTDSKEFVFACTIYNDSDPSDYHQISGFGSY